MTPASPFPPPIKEVWIVAFRNLGPDHFSVVRSKVSFLCFCPFGPGFEPHRGRLHLVFAPTLTVGGCVLFLDSNLAVGGCGLTFASNITVRGCVL